MRDLINLFENPGYLNWFWFNPSTNDLREIDGGTHTLYAIEELGLDLSDIEEIDTMADNDVLGHAIMAGWVRGRYGYDPADTGFHDPSNPSPDLNLQGRRRDVAKAAAWIAARWPVETLFVDFADNKIGGELHDSMDDGIKLTGERLEFFLKRGTVPSKMVQESGMRAIMNTVLNEGKDAPLFHGTEINAACHIIHDGKIDESSQYEHNPTGVSLSRSYVTALEFGTYWERMFPVVFVFDQQKLVHSRLKIIPRADSFESGYMPPKEAEEMVLSDLPLEPALISINISAEHLEQALGQIGEEYREYLNAEGWPDLTPEKWRANIEELMRHPKLNRWVPRIDAGRRPRYE